jgi:hypothetical protein
MRKLLLVFVALCMVFMMVMVASAGSDSPAQTVNGWVSDSMCAAKGAKAGHEACMKKCLEKGAKYVIVTDADQKVLNVDNPDALKGHEGHHVSVSGTTTADSIHIDSVKML